MTDYAEYEALEEQFPPSDTSGLVEDIPEAVPMTGEPEEGAEEEEPETAEEEESETEPEAVEAPEEPVAPEEAEAMEEAVTPEEPEAPEEVEPEPVTEEITIQPEPEPAREEPLPAVAEEPAMTGEAEEPPVTEGVLNAFLDRLAAILPSNVPAEAALEVPAAVPAVVEESAAVEPEPAGTTDEDESAAVVEEPAEEEAEAVDGTPAPAVEEQIIQLLTELREAAAPHPLLETDFADYTVVEGLLLLAVLWGVVQVCLRMLKGGFSWLLW